MLRQAQQQNKTFTFFLLKTLAVTHGEKVFIKK